MADTGKPRIAKSVSFSDAPRIEKPKPETLQKRLWCSNSREMSRTSYDLSMYGKTSNSPKKGMFPVADILHEVNKKWETAQQRREKKQSMLDAIRGGEESGDRREHMQCIKEATQFFSSAPPIGGKQRVDKFFRELRAHDMALIYFVSTWKKRKKEHVTKKQLAPIERKIPVIEVNIELMQEVADYFSVDLAPTVFILKDTQRVNPTRIDYHPYNGSFSEFVSKNIAPRLLATDENATKFNEMGFLSNFWYSITDFALSTSGFYAIRLTLAILYFAGFLYLTRMFRLPLD